MRRILEQELKGDEKNAEQKATYTWHKDEIAWRYCNAVHSIERIRFTGKRWLVGNKWGYSKIYQFEVLSSSSKHHNQGEITHDGENAFFETLESAREFSVSHINRLIEYETGLLKGSIEEIFMYCSKEMTFKKEVLTEKSDEGSKEKK